ncbi:hypothetical protein LA635_p1013 (plasmid) [Erwinia amylovora LA635]|uniref:Uncharacterized protein n=1 Tax=Erwinia amylovora TaxID=552 RepID=A0A0P0ZGG4_ERWAM|nr:hypothetical protein LA635_p1013 [Erwinia amylovora LA635]CDK23790.1 hypothetical protein LA636_p1012 [Erwinia amylovora LA636]CDK23840.1 hypothetical protein LA637_p1013 [Erwinia amylovora LA637]CDM08139.1 hypothetical protein EAMY692_p20013 [Erwinia amylovora]
MIIIAIDIDNFTLTVHLFMGCSHSLTFWCFKHRLPAGVPCNMTKRASCLNDIGKSDTSFNADGYRCLNILFYLSIYISTC